MSQNINHNGFTRVTGGISVRKVIKAKDVSVNETPFAKQQRILVASFRLFVREFPGVAIQIVKEEAGIVLK
jgi:hypothetical protein